MQLVSKSDIALLLIKKASEIEGLETPGIMGKKALQKSLYFLNEDLDIFKFKWGDYGPLCGEIQQIAEDLKSNGKIIVKEIPTKKQGAVTQNMTFSNESNSNFTDIEFPTEWEKSITNVTRILSGYKPRDLELFASVHYWAKKQQFFTDIYTPEYLYEKLLELKPDAGFSPKDVDRALHFLEHNDYLKK